MDHSYSQSEMPLTENCGIPVLYYLNQSYSQSKFRLTMYNNSAIIITSKDLYISISLTGYQYG